MVHPDYYECPHCGLSNGDHSATCQNRPFTTKELTPAEDVLRKIEGRLTGNTPQVSAVILSLGDIREYFLERS